MKHSYAINDDVHHQGQGPQGRTTTTERGIFIVVKHMPIEADGRIRYRIRLKSGNAERVVTEDELSRLVES